MRCFIAITVLALAAHSAAATGSGTALRAMKLLPKAQSRNVARIEARDGTPAPDRWHILVHDKSAENGLREYVVASGEVVASRTISQFAETLSPEDVIGTELLKVDSDEAAKVALEYALANNESIASMSYELKREGAEAAPLWKVTCFNDQGEEVGALVLTAGKGTIISHRGFPLEPNGNDVASDGFRPLTNTQVAADGGTEAPAGVANAKPAVARKVRKERTSRREPEPGFFGRAEGSLQKFFTGRNTISR
jgi:hypothetical protein